MPQWKVSTESCTIIISGAVDIAPADQIIRQFMTDIYAMHAVVHLASFRVTLTDPVSGCYSYRITAADGREWRQNLYIQPGGDFMTFNITDLWRLEEFAQQRPMRDTVFRLIHDLQCQKIVATWG
jgi:hypothetical protein